MNSANSNRQTSAFTLVEMLVVISIIGILAALLLPALTGSQMRAKRIVCESQLRQMGIAFQSFAHDHNGKFPMQVSTNDSGSLKFAQSGYLTNGTFYFGFRHFQPLAGILETPSILVCPADTRLPAANFAMLQNSNISYFVGVNADYSQPMSILAGDANLATASTLVRAAVGGRLTWTGAQHRFKGNVLFADGHVEEWSDGGVGTLGRSGDFVLPSVGGGNQSFQSAAASPASDTNLAAPSEGNVAQSSSPTYQPILSPTNHPASLPVPVGSGHDTRAITAGQSQTEVSNPIFENVPVITNISAGKV